MNCIKKEFLFSFIFCFLSISTHSHGQEGFSTPGNIAASPLVQQAVESGKVTPQQVQEGLNLLEQGTISPEEINEGQKILEQKNEANEFLEKTRADSKNSNEDDKKTGKFVKDTKGEKYPFSPIFGHFLFSKPPSTFAPISAIPISNNYLIGPGDEIKILMWGRFDARYSLEVDANGEINFPKIGPLSVAGLTFKELKELISQKVEAITGVSVNITMGRLRTIQVFVLGEVKSPGLYTVSSLATVSNALLSSGGPSTLGSLRKIQLKRGSEIISTIDFYNFLIKGDISADVRMMPGDVIFVPKAGPMVNVSGNVRRPAIYEFKDETTLNDAIDLAGGLGATALNQRIQIERSVEYSYQIVLDISYKNLAKEKNTKLQDGDEIKVFSMISTPINAIYLYGNALWPGKYALKPGLKISDIITGVDKLKPDTYFDYALVKRYSPEKMKAELIPFNLGELILKRSKTEDIPLMPLDEIYIFNESKFKDKKYADIKGEVRKPGRFYIVDMRIKDFIQMAGELTDNAYLPKAELIRVDKERKNHTIYFDVSAAMKDDEAHNLKLHHEDQIIIHSIWEKEWHSNVNISGEVKKGGDFLLTKEMTLKDLVFKAGSFTRDAYMEEGHLYRTNWMTKEVTIHTFNLNKAMEGDETHNLVLQDLDRVVIHNIRDYIPSETVSIEGQVNSPGAYPYGSNMKIRDLILVARNITRDAYMQAGHLYRTDWRTKDVTVYTFNPEKALTGDLENNLQLQELDKVVIHNIWEYKEKYTVSVKGMVHNPGEYQYATNMTIKDLILVAGNVKDGAYMEEAELVRYNIIEGKKVETTVLPFNLKLALENDNGHNLKVNPFDVIIIKEIPEWWEKKKTVTISGEVLFPGTYHIRKDETISAVIERAGNFTEYAYLRGAVFTRQSVKKIQQERLEQMTKELEAEIARLSSKEVMASLSTEDLSTQSQLVETRKALVEKLKQTSPTGRLTVKILPVDVLKKSEFDIPLENDDTFFVPKKPGYVNVLGAVYNPSSLLFNSNHPEMKHYLSKTGGPTKNSDDEHIYIVRVDGTVVSRNETSWFGASWDQDDKRWGFFRSFENTDLYPGDTIIVPEQLVKPNWMRDVKDISQILYQLAVTTGVTIETIFNNNN